MLPKLQDDESSGPEIGLDIDMAGPGEMPTLGTQMKSSSSGGFSIQLEAMDPDGIDEHIQRAETLEDTAHDTDIESHIGDKDAHELARKRLLHLCGGLIIFSSLLVFFMYELVFNYLDEDTNRREYSADKSVDSMPDPFIYLDFELSDESDLICELKMCTNIDCDEQHSQVVASKSTSDNDWNNGFIISDNDKMDDYINLNEWTILTDTTMDAVGYNTLQSLIIPISGEQIEVNSKEEIVLELICESSSDEDTINDVYFAVDNIDQLKEYSYVRDAMDEYHTAAEELRIDYEISFTYEWFSFKNKINPANEERDYYVTSVGSTFDISEEFENLSIDEDGINSGSVYSGVRLRFSPNTAGRKTIFYVDYRLDIWDVFSATGGIYSIVGDTVFFILSFILWGSIIDTQICKGVSPNTNPNETEERLSKKSKEEISKLNKRVADLAQHVLFLRKVIKSSNALKSPANSHRLSNNRLNTLRLTQIAFPDGNVPPSPKFPYFVRDTSNSKNNLSPRHIDALSPQHMNALSPSYQNDEYLGTGSKQYSSKINSR